MITGINYLRTFSVMITDWETNFTDLQANDFGNLVKNNSGNILVGNHAVIFTEINSPRFFSVGNVCGDNGIAFGVYPLFLPLAITAFRGPEGYGSLAIIAFGAFEFIVLKCYYRLGKTKSRSLDSLI